MDNNLAAALINKNIIPAGTEVESLYEGKALGGVSTVMVMGFFSIAKSYITESGAVFFDIASLRDGTISRVPADYVTSIDGMDPARFASVYGIKADGGAAAQKARRGRKPKDRSPEGLAKAAALAAAALKTLPDAANDDAIPDREVA